VSGSHFLLGSATDIFPTISISVVCDGPTFRDQEPAFGRTDVQYVAPLTDTKIDPINLFRELFDQAHAHCRCPPVGY
jgi:hypothetical protein